MGGRKQKRSWRDAQLGGPRAEPSSAGQSGPHADDDASEASRSPKRRLLGGDNKSKKDSGKISERVGQINRPGAATSEDNGAKTATFTARTSTGQRSHVTKVDVTHEEDAGDSDDDEQSSTESQGDNGTSVEDQDESSDWDESDDELLNAEVISVPSDDYEEDPDFSEEESEKSGAESQDDEENDAARNGENEGLGK